MASIMQPYPAAAGQMDGTTSTRFSSDSDAAEVLFDTEVKGGKRQRRKHKISSSSSRRVNMKHSTGQAGHDSRTAISDRASRFQAQVGFQAASRCSSSDEGDDECATPRASDSNHTSYINEFSPFSSYSTSASSSRCFTSSDTSPASPVRKTSSRTSPTASYRRQTTDEEFITRLRAGLTSSTASTSGTSPSIRRSHSSTPRSSRPSTRRHSRRASVVNSPIYNFSLPSLSPEAVQQLLSVSVYFLVTVVAGVALIGILAGSYAFSIGDDLKYRLIEAKLSAKEAVDLAKKEAEKIKIRLERKARQVGDSWSASSGAGASSLNAGQGPNYRELAGHVFQQVTPPFIYSFSNQCYQASSATYITISSIVDCATGRKSSRPPPRAGTASSRPGATTSPPRPPLKSLVPSLGIAILLAMLAFVRNTSFWQAQEQSAQVPPNRRRQQDSRNEL